MDPELESRIEKLLELIDEAVSGEAPWRKKRGAILAKASDNDKINLIEFASWFEEDQPEAE